ncbi:hypothetical protein [Kribbella sp. NPDC050470]|uniref:hypothetical protein n=1 Tax=unclassified Kribbella TaxID=2644121 RepID=UPI00378811E7
MSLDDPRVRAAVNLDGYLDSLDGELHPIAEHGTDKPLLLAGTDGFRDDRFDRTWAAVMAHGGAVRRVELRDANHWVFTDYAALTPQLQAAGLVTPSARARLIGSTSCGISAYACWCGASSIGRCNFLATECIDVGMRRLTGLAGTLSAVLLAATLVPTATASTTAVCGLRLGSVTASGGHRLQQVSATTPPSVVQSVDGPKDLFPDGQVRLATAVGWEPGASEGEHRFATVSIGNSLYDVYYHVGDNLTDVTPGTYEQTLIGGGWTPSITYVEESFYFAADGSHRANNYALWSGTIHRWNQGWGQPKVFKGFDAVKTMTLISQTPTYDTFLANTRGGALYTIRIPLSSTAVPIVKKVRTRTWQGFETLIAEKCGRASTLLLGIDKDTGSGYLYAMSHANGTATIINSLGKVPGTFTDPTHFRFRQTLPTPTAALNGE